MRRVLVLLSLGALPLLPASASAANFEVRLGGFFPSENSTLFSDDIALYTVQKSDFYGFSGGAQVNARLARNVEIGFSIDGYSRSLDTSYNSQVTSSFINQTLKLDEVPLGVTIRLIPTTRRGRIAPFLGVGGDLIFWHYEEIGNFIDFTQASQPVSPADFTSSGVTPGVHVEGGVRIPINYDWSFVIMGKYTWAKTDMGGDFPQERLDLGGANAYVGVNFHF